MSNKTSCHQFPLKRPLVGSALKRCLSHSVNRGLGFWRGLALKPVNQVLGKTKHVFGTGFQTKLCCILSSSETMTAAAAGLRSQRVLHV